MFHFNHVTPVLQGWPRRWKLSIDRSDFFGPSWEFLCNSTNKKGKEIKTVPVISRELELGLKPVNLVKLPITPALGRLKQDASETRSKRKKKSKNKTKWKRNIKTKSMWFKYFRATFLIRKSFKGPAPGPRPTASGKSQPSFRPGGWVPGCPDALPCARLLDDGCWVPGLVRLAKGIVGSPSFLSPSAPGPRVPLLL